MPPAKAASSGTKGANPFPPPSPSPQPHSPDNGSAYSTHTLRTLREGDRGSIGSDDEDGDDDGRPRIIHVRNGRDDDQSVDGSPSELEAAEAKRSSVERRRIVVRAFAQLAILFVVCSIVMGGTLYFALPQIDEADRPAFRIPKNFDQLKGLNEVLQRYKDENFGRVMLCWIVVYMFLQAFSIPGSMYMSILAGAMWGVPLALPIVCASVATGATICYLISKFLGEVLHAIPSWKARVDSWRAVLDRQRDDMLSYLIVIRMMPVPPHNIVNILAPHLGIKLPLFWFSTFCGIFAVSVIHTTIGEKLDQMASPADFNLFTLRNALLLGGVCVAVMVPVVLRKRGAAASDPLEEADAPQTGRLRLDDDGEPIPHRRSLMGMGRAGGAGRRVYGDGDGDDDDDDDELPPVRMRGAIAGFSRQSHHAGDGYDDFLDDVDEDAADVDVSGRRWSGSGTEDEASSLRGFRDRSEHPRPNKKTSAAATTNGGGDWRPVGARSKAARILGLGDGRPQSTSSRTAAAFGPGSTAPHPPAGGASITDSLAGGIESLWNRVSGSSAGSR